MEVNYARHHFQGRGLFPLGFAVEEQAGVDALCCRSEASLPVNVPSNKAMNVTGQTVCDWSEVNLRRKMDFSRQRA